MQKVIICDLDGTLLESNGKVSPDTIKMVQHFHKIGGIFIIATGRLDHDIVYIEEKLGIQGKYRVSQNGAVIKNQFNDVIWNRKMDPNAASRIVKFLRKKKLRVEVSDIKQRYFPSPRGLGGAVEFVDCAIVDPCYLQKIGKKILPSVIMTFGSEDIFRRLVPFINKNFGQHVDTIETSSRTLEILAKGVSKGAAVTRILQELQFDTSVCAIGDSANDISMFEIADYAFSVPKASVCAKDKADELYPTVGDCINAFIKK